MPELGAERVSRHMKAGSSSKQQVVSCNQLGVTLKMQWNGKVSWYNYISYNREIGHGSIVVKRDMKDNMPDWRAQRNRP